MISMLESELKRFRDRVISPFNYSLYFRFIDLLLATIIAVLPLAVRDDAISREYANELIAIINFMFIFSIIGHLLRLYNVDDIFDLSTSVRRFIFAALVSFFVLLLISVGLKSTQIYSRIWFFSWMVGYALVGIAIRIFLISYVENEFLKGNALRRALVVSVGAPGKLTDLTSQSGRKVRLVGHLEVPSISNAAVLESMARRVSADMIIIEVPWSNFQDISQTISKIFWSAVQDVYVVPTFEDSARTLSEALTIERFGHHYLYKLKERPIGGWNDTVKRLEDLIVSVLVIVLTSPVLLVTAIAIKLTSRGPVLFRQMRQGFAGETFEVWKFRTMFVDDTDMSASRQTGRNDPRVTPIGRFLRRSSLDELPQFFNVLQGSMSVVGPRPHALGTSVEGRSLSEIVDRYESRFRVKPGITGWAQVRGWRGELNTEDKIRNRVDHDRFYIENWSVYLDIKIILLTVIRVFYDPCAY